MGGATAAHRLCPKSVIDPTVSWDPSVHPTCEGVCFSRIFSETRPRDFFKLLPQPGFEPRTRSSTEPIVQTSLPVAVLICVWYECLQGLLHVQGASDAWMLICGGGEWGGYVGQIRCGQLQWISEMADPDELEHRHDDE